MQPRLLVVILPREPRVVGELHPIPIRVLVRGTRAKRIAVPAPHHFVAAVGGDTRGVEVVGVEVVNAGGGRGRWVGDGDTDRRTGGDGGGVVSGFCGEAVAAGSNVVPGECVL